MPTFVYRGETHDGEAVEETVEAPDRYAVYDIARENSHIVNSISEAKTASVSRLFDVERINVFLSRVGIDDLVMLTRNLAAMIHAGLPLSRALSIAERQTKNPRLQKTLEGVRERIGKGEPFSEALGAFPNTFTRLYVSMVHAGEESGQLFEALETIALQMERTSNLQKKIRGAMIYPAIVISVMLIIGVLMMIFVVPTLTTTFEKLEIELPVTTQIIIGISNFLSNSTLLAVLIFLGGIAALTAFYRTRAGRGSIEWMLLHFPIIGTLAREMYSARTARTLSSLLRAGVDVVGALSITEEVVQNTYYRPVIRDAEGRIEKGKPLSGAFIENENLYPPLFGEMVAVGEETGQIAQMLGEVADFYEGELERKTKNLSTIVEPILMVFIGTVVGFFALAMIAPIYSLSDSIG